jgi:NADH dehydrogenase
LGDRRIPYDYLVLATGARHAYFGRDGWEPFAPGLKKIEDAVAIRRRILEAFERAESEPNPARRRQFLNFVVVGGGPTGVEMAGAIAELAKKALTSDFRNIDPRTARIILVEGGPRVLPSFPEKLSRAAVRSLRKLGVDVRCGHSVSQCDGDGVVVDGERIPARTVIWAAGVIASPAAKWLGAKKDRAGRVVVRRDLSVPGHPDVFVIGDSAHSVDAGGRQLPGNAAVAKQQGRYVARLIRDRVDGVGNTPPFRYRDFGILATMGRKAAVAKLGKIELSGWPAWVIWSLVHIYFLIGTRNRMAVLTAWIWAYITFQHGSRLITQPGADPDPDPEPDPDPIAGTGTSPVQL